MSKTAPTQAREGVLLLPIETEARSGDFSVAVEAGCHRERSRLQLLFKLGGAENLSILAVNALAVNVLAVNRPLSLLECLPHSKQCSKVAYSPYIASYIRSPCFFRF